MSDSKKRPHESGGDIQAPVTEETAPVAKKMKLNEEPANATENTLPPLELPAYGASTDPGTRYGPLNQDCFFMDRLTQPNGNHVTIIGVFDGHGKHGEKASELASEVFQRSLKAHLMQSRHVSMRDHEKAMRNIFEAAHKRIISEYESLTTLDYDGFKFNLKVTADRVDFYAAAECPYVLLQDFGTTAVICVFWEESQKLMVANCGDSDALIGRWDAASSSLQPNLLAISDNVACTTNGEQERIRRDHGKKTKFGGGYLSPNDVTYGFHSLAMTRALGHKFLEKYGVTWDPHIRLFQITAEDVVLVVASDGLFDVVNSKAVLAVAAEKNLVDGSLRTLSPNESSERLVQLALGNWKKQFNSVDVADNTTVVVLKLSNQFDDRVPERDELASSGTTFSPAHVVFHAFETEIEETPRDNLEANGTQDSDTPVLPPEETNLDSNSSNDHHKSAANGTNGTAESQVANGGVESETKMDATVLSSDESHSTSTSETSNTQGENAENQDNGAESSLEAGKNGAPSIVVTEHSATKDGSDKVLQIVTNGNNSGNEVNEGSSASASEGSNSTSGTASSGGANSN